MELQTNPHNPRTISKDAYEKLKRSIERNPDGLTANKIAYKDGIIISGNQRYRAILELGLTIKPEWLKDLSGWTQEQIDEWVIQSNISAGEWDWDILANEWEQTDLEEWGVDTSQEWDNKKELPEDIDEIPAAPKTPKSKLGDLWLLGNHRVLCGDSTDQATVEKLMGGKKADMVFTDPPYGMNLDTDFSSMKSAMFKGKTGGAYHDKVIGDNEDFTPELITTIFDNFNYCKEIIIWGADYIAELLPARNAGSWFVWDKRLDDSADKMYGSSFELAWSKTRHKRDVIRHKWAGIFGMEHEDTKTRQHPTQKPIGLCDHFINSFSKAGHIIADLYLGSGATLIACEQTDRTCYGLELDPHYVDVICKRWQTLTGQMPILESSGEAHDFMVQ